MNHRHRKVLHAFFAHPVSSNIHFRDVEALVHELGGEVSNAHKGRLHLSLNGHSANFPVGPHSIPKDEVMRIRKFFGQCGIDPERDYPLHENADR
jgi:hypothetical protein